MLYELSNTVVVFDLDDTLYPEADYVNSGVRHVCTQIEALYGRKIFSNVQSALHDNPKMDWLSYVCECAQLPTSAKSSFLWAYRLHTPEIHLSPSCKKALRVIRSASRAVAILTDGRSLTQRLKLKALGLQDWPIYISEEYGAPKPSLERFKIIQESYPALNYIYVADNLYKDFLGCNSLGWIGIGMRANSRNIYPQLSDGLPKLALPKYWVNNWSELTELFFRKDFTFNKNKEC